MIPTSSQVIPGASVSIVLKQDQRTGRQVEGIVKDVLTRGNHPRGIKVRLLDNRIGRVQAMNNGHGHQWPGQSDAHRSTGTYSFPGQAQQGSMNYSTNQATNTQYGSQIPYSTTAQQSTPGASGAQYSTATGAQYRGDEFGLRDDERGEQYERMEVLQSNPSESDTEQSRLRDEFPNIDGSLIAALYADTQSYSGTKEIIQAMNE